MSESSTITCSFCGDDSLMVKSNDAAAICSGCIVLCVGIMGEALSRRARTFHMLPALTANPKIPQPGE